jgi:hypothetical protein
VIFGVLPDRSGAGIGALHHAGAQQARDAVLRVVILSSCNDKVCRS